MCGTASMASCCAKTALRCPSNSGQLTRRHHSHDRSCRGERGRRLNQGVSKRQTKCGGGCSSRDY